MDIIAEVLAAAGTTYANLDRIAACAGPGSFTGVRVGLVTARGIALGLGIPVVGVNALAALAAEAEADLDRRAVMVLLDARRGEAYAEFFGSVPQSLPQGPFVAGYEAIAAMVGTAPGLSVCGSGAPVLARETGISLPILHELSAAPVARYARLGASAIPGPRPEPIYLRPPDAKPQAGFAVMRG